MINVYVSSLTIMCQNDGKVNNHSSTFSMISCVSNKTK